MTFSTLKVDRLIDPKRPYISSKLHIYLTLSNLRGVPYKVPFNGPVGDAAVAQQPVD